MRVAGVQPDYSWNLAPLVILSLLLYAGLYAWRFRAARREQGGKGAGPGQAAAFTAAMIVLAIALVSPIDTLGEDYLFSMHMAQHLLLGDIAPLLVVLALSRVILRPATRRLMAVERALGPLAHPVTALVIWVGLIYVWHVPALYDAALGNAYVHVLEHLSFFAGGLLFWWALVQPVPMRRRLRGMSVFAYVGTGKLALGALGLLLIWAPDVLYAHYQHVPRIWGLTVGQDQAVGGLTMMLEQSLVLVTALVWLFVRMLDQSEQEERRRERYGAGAPT